MHHRVAYWASILVAIALLPALACAPASDEEAAADAATKWLSLIDAESYSASWDQAAPPLQGAVTKEDWGQAIGALRSSLGKMISRELTTAEARTSLPGAPDGRYVVIQFETSFEQKESAIETVTPMYEDGKWRVSGYFVN